MSTGRPRKPAGPAGEALDPSRDGASPVDDAVVDAHAAGEIAHHWHEAGNWLRLQAVLTDRAMLGAILRLRSRSEVLEWWTAIERETGARIEERYEDAWRRWGLDADNPATRDETRNLAIRLVSLLFEAGRCGEFTERLLRTALRIDAEDHGDDSEEVGMHLAMLGRLLVARGDYVVGEEVCRRALAISERTDGPDSWSASLGFNALAGVFLERDEYAEAARLYRRSLAIAEHIAGPQSEGLLPVLRNLVNALVLLGDFEAAEPPARRVLAIAESAAEPDPLAIGRYVQGLAGVLEGKGDHAAALELRRRALAIAEKELGRGHPAALHGRIALAETLTALGRAMEAEGLLRLVVEIADAEPGDAGAEFLPTALMMLGEQFSQQDRYAEAAPCFERVLAMLDDPADAGEADPVALVVVLQQLGVAYRETGRLAEAGRVLVRALHIAGTDGFLQPLLHAKVLSALGRVRFLEGQFAASEELFVRCLEIRRARLADGHPDIVQVQGRLAEASERRTREEMGRRRSA